MSQQKISDWLKNATEKLREMGTDNPRNESLMILSKSVGIEKEKLIAYQNELIQTQNADELLERRLREEPMAYIIGEKDFYKKSFFVNEHVLIPRPETEFIVELAIPYLNNCKTALDVGTGSGVIAISLSLENKNVHWIASDVSLSALQVAKRNVLNHDANVHLICCDMLSGFKGNGFDLIVSNPPYIAQDDQFIEIGVKSWEPATALFADDGMKYIKQLAKEAKEVLKQNGILIFEFGFNQSLKVEQLLHDDWEYELIRDLSNIDRIAIAKKK